MTYKIGVDGGGTKTEGILVDAAGEPKVIDFGIARGMEDELAAQTRVTQTGQLLGTLHFMAPEQFVDGKGTAVVDARTDVYALGVVLDEGAEEVNDLGESFEVVCEATDLVKVRTAVQAAGMDYESADATLLPSVTVMLDEDGARKVFRLLEALDEIDDVQNVYANFDVSDEVMAAID